MKGKTAGIFIEHKPQHYVGDDVSITITRKPDAADDVIQLVGEIMLGINKLGGVVETLVGSCGVVAERS